MLGHIFLLLSPFRFSFLISISSLDVRFCCWFEPSAGWSYEETRERELGTSAASFVMSESHRGGNMRQREYMGFPSRGTHRDIMRQRKKERERRIICRPACRCEYLSFHTQTNSLSLSLSFFFVYTRPHTKVNECERICMCYSGVQRCWERPVRGGGGVKEKRFFFFGILYKSNVEVFAVFESWCGFCY